MKRKREFRGQTSNVETNVTVLLHQDIYIDNHKNYKIFLINKFGSSLSRIKSAIMQKDAKRLERILRQASSKRKLLEP